MIGGTVVCVSTGEVVALVTVAEWDAGRDRLDTAAALSIRVKHRGYAIMPGDSIWWQSRAAMWTPAGSAKREQGVDYDVVLERVGYSHATPVYREAAG